jgi:hypothetical protein
MLLFPRDKLRGMSQISQVPEWKRGKSKNSLVDTLSLLKNIEDRRLNR